MARRLRAPMHSDRIQLLAAAGPPQGCRAASIYLTH
jgi:hypothetical protein